MTTPTQEQLAEWTNAAQKVWDGQGRTHWVNMDQFDNYVAGYLRAKTEAAIEIAELKAQLADAIDDAHREARELDRVNAQLAAPRKITADMVTDEMIASINWREMKSPNVILATAYNAVNAYLAGAAT